ncbi:alpha/beta hydrolase family protein [Mycobacterium intracellulare 1956]|uniref:Alpha/beta hydrolase family protein n=1 Tax=Mycobacterium intracellulare 1956 TaxID=1299331 RepID=X8CFE6_MYCIT|nr:alpha/beta hydrolase family protein [Mycobacterium intracellulare 1956]
MVLIHGGGAHSGWWDHIAPFISRTHRVIALDLSGHGDSGSRANYDLRIWASEVMAAASAAGPPGGRPSSATAWAVGSHPQRRCTTAGRSTACW